MVRGTTRASQQAAAALAAETTAASPTNKRKDAPSSPLSEPAELASPNNKKARKNDDQSTALTQSPESTRLTRTTRSSVSHTSPSKSEKGADTNGHPTVSTRTSTRSGAQNVPKPIVTETPKGRGRGRPKQNAVAIPSEPVPLSSVIDVDAPQLPEEVLVDQDHLFDDTDEEMEGSEKGLLSKKKKREILGLIIAMETQLNAGEATTSRSRPTNVRIVDIGFRRPLKPELPIDTVEKVNGEDEDHPMNGDAKPIVPQFGPELTLRKILAGSTKLTIQGLYDDLFTISQLVIPTLPNPFNDLSTAMIRYPPAQFAAPLTARSLNNSRTRPDKDLPIHGHLSSIASLLPTIIPDGPPPVPKMMWALHQRTTIPFPIPLAKKGEKVVPVSTDRVHLDWFTSLMKTGDGDMKDALRGKMEEDQITDGEVDFGGVTRLQAEGMLAYGDIITIPVRDRSDENENRLKAPRLGDALYSYTSRKIKAYRDQRRDCIQRGRPVDFLQHTSSFTPSFAPTYDSTRSSYGWSYTMSVDVPRVAAANREWLNQGWGSDYVPASNDSVTQMTPSSAVNDAHLLDISTRAARELVDDDVIDPALLGALTDVQRGQIEIKEKLQQNDEWLRELAYRQEVRLRRGQREPTDPEEHIIATKLSRNLHQLAANTKPRDLLNTRAESATSLAVRLAQAALRSPSSSIRGTLDPACSTALIENHTISTRTEPVAPKRREPNPSMSSSQTRTPLPIPQQTRPGPMNGSPSPLPPQRSNLPNPGMIPTQHRNMPLPIHYNGMMQQSIPRSPAGPPMHFNNLPVTPQMARQDSGLRNEIR